MQHAPKHDVDSPAVDKQPQQDSPAQPRYFEDAAGHRSILHRLGGDARLEAGERAELEQRWPPGAAILFAIALSAACWTGLAGVAWAVAG